MPDLANITGAEQFADSLRELDRKVQTTMQHKALRVGGKILQAQMRADAPKKSGSLERSIILRPSKSRRTGALRMLVGLFKSAFKGKNWQEALGQEYGWNAGFKAKRAEPGKHFVERAGETRGNEAGDAIVDSLASQLDEAI